MGCILWMDMRGAPHLRGGVQLAGDRAQELDALLERADGGAQTLEAHGADQICRIEKPFAVDHGEAADGGHELRAVEERKALFGFEREGREPRGLQSRPGRLAPAVQPEQLALAHHREHEVRGRGEVAGGAQRAARRHPRHEVGVEHRRHELSDRDAHAGVAARHRVEADRHAGAHDLARERHAHADGVASHKVLLQLVHLVGGDVRGGKLAEAGGHAVGDLLFGHDLRDHFVGAVDALARRRAEAHLGSTARHGHDIVDGERGVADHDLRHCDRLPSRRCLSSGTTSAGAHATGIPAASRAAFLSAAVPDEPSTIAPAWPMRLPGGAPKPAM